MAVRMALQDGGRARRFVTGPSSVSRTASALRAIGHRQDDQRAAHDLPDGHRDRLVRNVVEGRKPALAELLAAASLVELDHACRARSPSKSAGGSLKARWPFSPMPAKVTSIGCAAIRASERARVSASRSAASPLMKWKAPRAGQVGGETVPAGSGGSSPDASPACRYIRRGGRRSRATSRSPVRLTSAARSSNWLAPVATTMLARPALPMAARIALAPAAAAASPSAILEGCRSIWIMVISLLGSGDVVATHLRPLLGRWETARGGGAVVARTTSSAAIVMGAVRGVPEASISSSRSTARRPASAQCAAIVVRGG